MKYNNIVDVHVQACSRKHTTVKMVVVVVCACAVCSIKISSSFFLSILFMFPMYLLYSLSCCDFLRFCFLESSIPYSSILHSVMHVFYIPTYIFLLSMSGSLLSVHYLLACSFCCMYSYLHSIYFYTYIVCMYISKYIAVFALRIV